MVNIRSILMEFVTHFHIQRVTPSSRGISVPFAHNQAWSPCTTWSTVLSASFLVA